MRGVAIVVQVMVTATGERAASGRVFSRSPQDGSKLATLGPWNQLLHERLTEVVRAFERHERRAQGIEFVADEAQLALLQSAPLRVGPLAAARIDLDMVDDGIIGPAEAAARLAVLPLDDLDTEELAAPGPCVAAGIAASPGIGSGICFRDPAEAALAAQGGADVVLVRPETSPKDLPAMKAARAILTERGDEASHAAIVAREFKIPCVVGCGDLEPLDDGAALTVNGSTGDVYGGRHTPRRVTPPHVQRARALLASHQERERS